MPENMPAAGPEGLHQFMETLAVAAQLLPPSMIRQRVLADSYLRGYPTDVRVALGRLISAVAVDSTNTLKAARGEAKRSIV